LRRLKWRTHIRILKAVIEIAFKNLDAELVRGLFRGIVEPDKLPDYDVKKRRLVKQHDKTVKELVKYYLRLAIYLYNSGKVEEAGRALGRAIHYAQDLVLKRRRYLIFDVHDKIEEELERYFNKIDKKMILECIHERPRRSNNPETIICSAISITYRVLKAFSDGIGKRNLMRRVLMIITLSTLSLVCLSSLSTMLSCIVYKCLIAITLILLLSSLAIILNATVKRPRCRRFRTVM